MGFAGKRKEKKEKGEKEEDGLEWRERPNKKVRKSNTNYSIRNPIQKTKLAS